jgi:hypothetical protein
VDTTPNSRKAEEKLYVDNGSLILPAGSASFFSGARLGENNPVNIVRILHRVKPELAGPEFWIEHAVYVLRESVDIGFTSRLKHYVSDCAVAAGSNFNRRVRVWPTYLEDPPHPSTNDRPPIGNGIFDVLPFQPVPQVVAKHKDKALGGQRASRTLGTATPLCFLLS